MSGFLKPIKLARTPQLGVSRLGQEDVKSKFVVVVRDQNRNGIPKAWVSIKNLSRPHGYAGETNEDGVFTAQLDWNTQSRDRLEITATVGDQVKTASSEAPSPGGDWSEVIEFALPQDESPIRTMTAPGTVPTAPAVAANAGSPNWALLGVGAIALGGILWALGAFRK